jgi:hypothetical protein
LGVKYATELTSYVVQSLIVIQMGKGDVLGRGRDQRWEPDDHDVTMASRKLADPSKYPRMNAREVAAALGISLKSVYEHPGLEEVATGTRRRLWSTESVRALINSRPK